MLYKISGILLLSLRTNLYGTHIFLSDTNRHVHEMMLMRIEDGYSVAYPEVFRYWLLSALRIESHGKFMSSSITNMEA